MITESLISPITNQAEWAVANKIYIYISKSECIVWLVFCFYMAFDQIVGYFVFVGVVERGRQQEMMGK